MKKESSEKNRGPRRARIGCSLLLLAIASVSLGCSGSKAEPPATKVVETNTDPDVFTMQDPSQFSLTAAQARKVSDEVHVNCSVTPDVNRSVPVVSLGGGQAGRYGEEGTGAVAH